MLVRKRGVFVHVVEEPLERVALELLDQLPATPQVADVHLFSSCRDRIVVLETFVDLSLAQEL